MTAWFLDPRIEVLFQFLRRPIELDAGGFLL